MWPAGIAKNTVLSVKLSDVCTETTQSRSSSVGGENNTVAKPDEVDSLSTPVATTESGNTTISTTNTNKTNIPTNRINTSNTVGMSRRGGSRGILHPVFAPLECTTLAINDEDNEDSEKFNVKVQI
ncbi:hypothetical protein LSM04_008301 [Trypanosoma melophagium]|uniref:uncharacterized protein n=1 Tax=Trypanosoma melophagium TaxID=715481 RepID=UPI00351A8CFC|nr:hypothetical protein LSM04_008301 [Trypanosoma melophagium]